MIGKINSSISINTSLGGTSKVIGKISGSNKLQGMIHESQNIKGSVHSVSNITGSVISTNNLSYTTNLDNSSALPNYTGAYTIIPTVDDQPLETKNKVLRENILVKSIPYFQTSNEFGDTVYIG